MNLPAHDRQALAAKCGIGDAYLYQVLTRRRIPSAELCVVIERASAGAVTRRDLRPDDWQKIWPELANSEEKQPIPSAARSSAATEAIATLSA